MDWPTISDLAVRAGALVLGYICAYRAGLYIKAKNYPQAGMAIFISLAMLALLIRGV